MGTILAKYLQNATRCVFGLVQVSKVFVKPLGEYIKLGKSEQETEISYTLICEYLHKLKN
jgi:hypothetical protein